MLDVIPTNLRLHLVHLWESVVQAGQVYFSREESVVYMLDVYKPQASMIFGNQLLCTAKTLDKPQASLGASLVAMLRQATLGAKSSDTKGIFLTSICCIQAICIAASALCSCISAVCLAFIQQQILLQCSLGTRSVGVSEDKLV